MRCFVRFKRNFKEDHSVPFFFFFFLTENNKNEKHLVEIRSRGVFSLAHGRQQSMQKQQRNSDRQFLHPKKQVDYSKNLDSILYIPISQPFILYYTISIWKQLLSFNFHDHLTTRARQECFYCLQKFYSDSENEKLIIFKWYMEWDLFQ